MCDCAASTGDAATTAALSDAHLCRHKGWSQAMREVTPGALHTAQQARDAAAHHDPARAAQMAVAAADQAVEEALPDLLKRPETKAEVSCCGLLAAWHGTSTARRS